MNSKLLSTCKHFILLRVTMDPVPVLGTLSMRQEYILDGMCIIGQLTNAQTKTHTYPHVFGEVGGNWRTRKKPTETL